MTHRVHTRIWIDGKLVRNEKEFNSFEDAKVFADSSGAERYKIYDDKWELVASGDASQTAKPTETYA
jgi:hypothetical protein